MTGHDRVIGTSRAAPGMASVLAAAARALVSAQAALDESARSSVLRWEEEAIPPAALVWRDCRLSWPVDFRVDPKTEPFDRTQFTLRPRLESRGRVTFVLRYVPEDG